MSRDINQLHPEMIERYMRFREKMSEKGLSFVLTCADRTILEQMALYSMGRMPLIDVTRMRFIAKLSNIKEEQNRKVTWTLASKHITNMFDDDLNNDYSRAFDIAMLKDNRSAHWDLKVSVNDNDIPDYMEAGMIGESCDLVWGGRWRKKDYVHFQLPEDVI